MGATSTVAAILLVLLDTQAKGQHHSRVAMFKAFVSPLAPNALLSKVRAMTDLDEIDPGHATFFPGSQPLVGHFTARHFVLQQRPRLPWGLWLLSPATWFRPLLSGTVRPREQGSELQLEGDDARIVRPARLLDAQPVGGLFGAD